MYMYIQYFLEARAQGVAARGGIEEVSLYLNNRTQNEREEHVSMAFVD